MGVGIRRGPENAGVSAPRAGAALLAKYVADKGAKVLDAGAGTGMVGEELAGQGFKRGHGAGHVAGDADDGEGEGCLRRSYGRRAWKPLPFETDGFVGTTCIGVLTFGHAPAGGTGRAGPGDEGGRGRWCSQCAPDFYTEGGFDVKQAALEAAGTWRLLERVRHSSRCRTASRIFGTRCGRTRCRDARLAARPLSQSPPEGTFA